MAENKLRITDDLIDSIINRSSFNKDIIFNECQKLVLLTKARKIDFIDGQILNELSLPDLQANVFDFIDLMMSRNFSGAYNVLLKLENRGEEAHILLINLLASHIKKLIFAKSVDNVQELYEYYKLPPFVINKLYQQAKKFQVESLYTLYSYCYNMDVALKTGGLAKNLVLPLLVTQFRGIMV